MRNRGRRSVPLESRKHAAPSRPGWEADPPSAISLVVLTEAPWGGGFRPQPTALISASGWFRENSLRAKTNKDRKEPKDLLKTLPERGGTARRGPSHRLSERDQAPGEANTSFWYLNQELKDLNANISSMKQKPNKKLK